MNVTLEYYAMLREQSGLDTENLKLPAGTARDVYEHVAAQHNFTLGVDSLRVAVNDEFTDWDHVIEDGDKIVFIPPVSGG